MFWECPGVQLFWSQVTTSISKVLNKQVPCCPVPCLLNDNSFAKKMLVVRWKPPHTLSLEQWWHLLIHILHLEFSAAKSHGAQEKNPKIMIKANWHTHINMCLSWPGNGECFFSSSLTFCFFLPIYWTPCTHFCSLWMYNQCYVATLIHIFMWGQLPLWQHWFYAKRAFWVSSTSTLHFLNQSRIPGSVSHGDVQPARYISFLLFTFSCAFNLPFDSLC